MDLTQKVDSLDPLYPRWETDSSGDLVKKMLRLDKSFDSDMRSGRPGEPMRDTLPLTLTPLSTVDRR